MRIKQGIAKNKPLRKDLRRQMTGAERKLWSRLRANQFYSLKFRRQHGIGTYIVDFYCAEKRVVIEVDGNSHFVGKQYIKDAERENYLRSLGVEMIRYTNLEVTKNIQGVLEDLRHRLGLGFLPPPTPPYKGGVIFEQNVYSRQ